MLTVLTLNIWNYEGPWSERLSLIRDWIHLLDPDLIAMQEVLHNHDFDQAAVIFDGFSYHRAYAGRMDYWNDTSLKFGNLIASRWPITDQEIVDLPMKGTGDQRAILCTSIQSPFGDLSFSTTHLSAGLHQGHIREQQIRVVGDTILRRRTRNGLPAIICGDFNATPDSAEIRYMKGLQANGDSSLVMIDAWESAGDGSDGYTFSRNNDYLGSRITSDRRLDYIFVEPIPGSSGRVNRCRLVCHVPRRGHFPSDHFGLFTEITTPEDLQSAD